MRLVQPSAGHRLPWSLAAAVALTAIGCGGSEEGKTSQVKSAATPVPSTPAAGQPAATPVDPAAAEVTPEQPFSPFTAPLEGPIEYEEGVQAPLVASFPDPEAIQPPPAIDDLPDEHELLGKPLVINGKVVPFEEVKKQICLGVLGLAEIVHAKMRIFIQEEQRRLAEAGAGPERLEIGSDELSGYLKGIEEEIKSEFPEGEVVMQDLFNGLAAKDPQEKLRVQRLFEKLFMPSDPAQFPPLTLEAILKQQGGQAVLDHYKSVHEARLESGGPANKDGAERQFDSAILQQVHEHLNAVATVLADPAPGVLFRVNGVDITMDEVWEEIKPRVTVMEVRAAKQWIAHSTLLKEAFMAAGAWVSDEEAEAEYRVHSDPYKDSMFSQERIALMVKRFPSIDHYKLHRRFLISFQRMRPPTAEDLKRVAEARTNRLVGQVSADVDVILCSAFDYKANRWKENGWVEAENRMKDVLKLLVEEQRPWDELVERYSDFYEPPTPLSMRNQVDPNKQLKGRFRNIQRNELAGQLGEAEYSIFLDGSSIADFIFFEQEVGTLGQPMRGPFGWYLPRLIKRSKAPLRLAMDEETMQGLVLDDYLGTQLIAFTQELLQKNEVYGLELPGTNAR